MNKLTSEQRAHILHLLCEGMSIRAVTRLTGASKNTVAKLLNDAGAALGAYQDAAFRNLSCAQVQVDEIWSFCYAKQKNVAKAKAAPEGAGDVWTWTAIDADTKLVFSVMVGGRDADYAQDFLADVRARIDGRFQLTSDGHSAYKRAVRRVFGDEIDYAQLVKIYGAAPDAGRYSPAACIGANPTQVAGSPDMSKVSTSYVERQNLTMRMHMRRFTRLTNGFSKKVEAHSNAISLHFAYYNFVRIHKTLRISPAMAAGVSDRLWEMADLVAVVEAAEAKPGKRGPYKKRVAAE
ncbi:MAG: DDE-type integrase/transposase/recombinase [Caulobacter sp.]|nr:DDE-type integrase/transposase/recombinase [Caulobacter sp.]